MRIFSRICFIVLIVLVASFYLPRFYEQLVISPIEKTHLFYSPVAEEFIYTEKISGTVPPEMQQHAEEHHLTLAYRTESGRWLSRLEFERLLPFIYYKNMEIRGLLPMRIAGRDFTKMEMKKGRRVLEVRAREMTRPQTRVYPLLESEPGQARLVFPDDRFYSSADGLIFFNADTRRPVPALSEQFSAALREVGCSFPVVEVFGKFSVLKQLDEGAFLLDSAGRLFHLKRKKGQPQAAEVPLPDDLKVRYVKVSETKKRDYYGLVVGQGGEVLLLSCDQYRLIPLPLKNYNPKIMDLRLLFNPVFVTATFSDENRIYGVVMDQSFQAFQTITHSMSRAEKTLGKRIAEILFPFVLKEKRPSSGFVDLHFVASFWGLLGIVVSLLVYFVWQMIVQKKMPSRAGIGVVALSGVYGLVALLFVEIE